MHSRKIATVKSIQQGVALVEAMVAIVIFSVGVLGIVGMQANMIKNTSSSKYRIDASNIARETIGTMWSDTQPVGNLDNYVKTTNISTLLPNGSLTVAKTSVLVDSNGIPIGGVFTVNISWKEPGDQMVHTFTTVANIVAG